MNSVFVPPGRWITRTPAWAEHLQRQGEPQLDGWFELILSDGSQGIYHRDWDGFQRYQYAPRTGQWLPVLNHHVTDHIDVRSLRRQVKEIRSFPVGGRVISGSPLKLRFNSQVRSLVWIARGWQPQVVTAGETWLVEVLDDLSHDQQPLEGALGTVRDSLQYWVRQGVATPV
jgi:hypothetical protein